MQHTLPFPRVILKPRRARPFFGWHPWVFAGAIDRVEGEPGDGGVVNLVSDAGEFIARGFYNSQSKIRVRLCTWNADEALDVEFFRHKLQSAIRLRRETLGLTESCRLVFSEADGLSGLTVDQFDRWLVVQFTSLAMAQRKDIIADLLDELLQPTGIYLRTERGVGQLEGLDLRDGPLRGETPPIVSISENGLKLQVHLIEGQKTGFYLDQRDNRQTVARLAIGRRMLDAFCYSGGFALHAARAGAAQVLGIDSSEAALSLARANAELNGLQNVVFEKADVFEKLDGLITDHASFGVIVLDPPKFARTGSAVSEALRGYQRLIAKALRLLETDGVLVMCCCSGLIERQAIHDLLGQESVKARRAMQILESRGAAPDHPVSAHCPETNYLKCIVCRVE